MNKYDEFIFKYNRLETLLHKLPNAPLDANMKWYEDSLEDNKIKNKLYISRVTRNFIQHNEDYKNFIEVSDGMINFLDDIYVSLYSNLITAEKIMIPLKKIYIGKISDKVYETINIMNSKNLELIPIIDNSSNKLIKVLTIKNLPQIFEKVNKKTTFKEFLDTKELEIPKDYIKFVNKDTLLEDIILIFENSRKNKKVVQYIIVTDTGTSKGDILGIISPFEAYNFMIK